MALSQVPSAQDEIQVAGVTSVESRHTQSFSFQHSGSCLSNQIEFKAALITFYIRNGSNDCVMREGFFINKPTDHYHRLCISPSAIWSSLFWFYSLRLYLFGFNLTAPINLDSGPQGQLFFFFGKLTVSYLSSTKLHTGKGSE